jgi:acetylornithine/succinyldiaminopimelate/putrescine aminotransferase
MGQYLCDGLRKLAGKYDVIKEVRGKGLLVAVQFNQDIAAGVVLSCLELGIIVNKAKPDVIRFIPPLIVKEAEIDRAIDVLDKVLKERQ